MQSASMSAVLQAGRSRSDGDTLGDTRPLILPVDGKSYKSARADVNTQLQVGMSVKIDTTAHASAASLRIERAASRARITDIKRQLMAMQPQRASSHATSVESPHEDLLVDFTRTYNPVMHSSTRAAASASASSSPLTRSPDRSVRSPHHRPVRHQLFPDSPLATIRTPDRSTLDTDTRQTRSATSFRQAVGELGTLIN